jgi:hypothetical protein
MISAQTRCVCREGKPLHTFPDHAPDIPAGQSPRVRLKSRPAKEAQGLKEIPQKNTADAREPKMGAAKWKRTGALHGDFAS